MSSPSSLSFGSWLRWASTTAWVYILQGRVTQPLRVFCAYCTVDRLSSVNIREKREKSRGLYVNLSQLYQEWATLKPRKYEKTTQTTRESMYNMNRAWILSRLYAIQVTHWWYMRESPIRQTWNRCGKTPIWTNEWMNKALFIFHLPTSLGVQTCFTPSSLLK